MKRIRLVIATTILLQAFAWSRQPASVPPDNLRFDRGTIAGGTYTNGCLGLTFSIPDGWDLSSIPGLTSGHALHLPGGGLRLLIIGRHREDSFGDQISLDANDASKNPTLTAEAFVRGAAQSLVNVDREKREIVHDAFVTEYAGKQFYRVDYKQSISNGVALYIGYAYTKFGGYFIGVTVAATSPERLNEAADSLKGISFQRDSPSSSCVVGPNDGPLMGVIGSVRSSASGASASRVRVSQGVSQALLVKRVEPVYPEAARQSHLEGTVVLDTKIDVDGNVEDVTVISGPPLLVPAAVDAVKQWKYKPYTLDGKPAKIETPTVLTFQSPPN